MPLRGRKKVKPVNRAPPSPYKTRSGVVRQVKFSPQVDLQKNINSANVTLNTMPCKRTPVGKIAHPSVNTETPQNTSASGIGSEERTTRSALRKQLSYTPAGSVQNNSPVGGEEEALTEAVALDSTYVRECLDNNDEPSSEEEGSSSVRQYEANLDHAERTPYRQMMSETVTMSHEDMKTCSTIFSHKGDCSMKREREKSG